MKSITYGTHFAKTVCVCCFFYEDMLIKLVLTKKNHLEIFSFETVEPNLTNTCTEGHWVVPFQNCIQKPWPLSKDDNSYLFEDVLLWKHWANLNQIWPEPSLAYISDDPSTQPTWLFLLKNYRTLGVKYSYKEFQIVFFIKKTIPAAYSALYINVFACV